jgi:uncharacterized RDD family membrane protein YckC
MDTTNITATSFDRPMSYAGFWKRFAAYLIDSIVIGMVAMIVILPFFIVMGFGIAMTAMSEDSEQVIPAVIGAVIGYLFIILLAIVGQWLYFALMESSKHQGTLGKMALGIKVTDVAGNRLTFGRATGRYFAKIISGMTMGIGYLLAAFTEKKQALHDMIAGCLVLDR